MGSPPEQGAFGEEKSLSMSGGMWEPEGGRQRLGRQGGQSRRVTLQSLDIPPQSKEGTWSASGGHSSSPQGWAGGPVWRWGVLRKVPHLRKKHQRRREVGGFGTCLASTKRTCGETAGGRDGSGARRTLRFLSWEHGTQGERGTP